MPPNAGTAGAPAPSSSLYQSAFSDYKPYKEPALISWRQANDQVRETGGMQGHDKATMTSPPSKDPHAGHDLDTPSPANKATAGHPEHGTGLLNEAKIKKEKP